MLVAYSFLPGALFRFTPESADTEVAIFDPKARQAALEVIEKQNFPARIRNGESVLLPENSAEYEIYFARPRQVSERVLPLHGAFDGTTFNLPLVGMTTLWGGSGSAKTLLLNYIYSVIAQDSANAGLLQLSTFLEPEIRSLTGEPAMLSKTELAMRITSFLCSPARVLGIDSLRALVYAADSGATGKGGMNMTIFSQLTALSIIAERLGKGLITVINPLTTDQDALDMYETALAGSVTTSIRTSAPGSFTVTTRMSDVLPTRDARGYRFNVIKAVEATRGIPIEGEQPEILDLSRARVDDETFRRTREVR